MLYLLATLAAAVPATNPANSITIDSDTGAIITALALLVTSITGLFVAIKARSESATAREENRVEVAKVNTLVNGHSTAQAREIGALIRALNDAGIPIPPPEVIVNHDRRAEDTPASLATARGLLGAPVPAVARPAGDPLVPGDEVTITGQIDTP